MSVEFFIYVWEKVDLRMRVREDIRSFLYGLYEHIENKIFAFSFSLKVGSEIRDVWLGYEAFSNSRG
jgi:hypothetical protein